MNQTFARYIKRLSYSAIRATKELPPHIPEFRHAPILPKGSSYSPWLTDEHFQRAMKAVQNNTLVDPLRCYELWSLVQQSAKLSQGALIEVGVWRGGTGCLIAESARVAAIIEPTYLCDTFSGVVNAGKMDTRYKGGEHSDSSPADAEILAHTMGLSSIRVLQGIFPGDTGHQIGDSFRFIHLDLDVYESTRQSLSFLWPRLELGGIVVFDDYGTHGCEGVTRLVNEVARDRNLLFVHNANGHAILIKIAAGKKEAAG